MQTEQSEFERVVEGAGAFPARIFGLQCSPRMGAVEQGLQIRPFRIAKGLGLFARVVLSAACNSRFDRKRILISQCVANHAGRI